MNRTKVGARREIQSRRNRLYHASISPGVLLISCALDGLYLGLICAVCICQDGGGGRKGGGGGGGGGIEERLRVRERERQREDSLFTRDKHN